jgi:hypothetical protein
MFRLLTICGVLAVLPLLGKAADEQSATIVDSGSTNRAGFRIVVERAGSAEFTATRRSIGPRTDQPQTVHKTLPSALVEAFYDDLAAAKPLASLPQAHCFKSASFGSSLTVELNGEETPDLSCGDGDHAALRNLIRETRQIISFMQQN